MTPSPALPPTEIPLPPPDALVTGGADRAVPAPGPHDPGVLQPRLFLLLMCAVALTSGGVGAALAVTFSAPPPPALRMAVLDTTRIAEALAQTAGTDQALSPRFTRQFDEIIRRLHEAEPTRVILIREAVATPELEDLTPMVLHALRDQGLLTAPPLKRPTP